MVLLAICGMLAFAAVAVGVDDNPPGLLLAILSAVTFTIAFVHPWRASANFRRLMYASGIGFLACGILHNVFEAVATGAVSSGLAHDLMSGAGVVFFLVAILLCPPAFLVSAIGAIVMSRRARSS